MGRRATPSLDGQTPGAPAGSSARPPGKELAELDVGDTAASRLPGRSRGPRASPREDDLDLGRFSPPPGILAAPLGHPTGAPPPTAPGAPAEIEALAERLLCHLRVGRHRDGSPSIRMRVDGRGRGDLDVELRQTAEGLVAIVDPADGDRRRGDEWAERLGAALRARGLDLHRVEIA